MKKKLIACVEREEAAAAGNRFFTSHAPCRNGHIGKRYTNSGACFECARLYRLGVEPKATTHSEMKMSVLSSVYVVTAGEYVKVGIAEHVHKRFPVLQSNCPLTAKIAFCSDPIPRLDARAIEESCFIKFSPYHQHGEWYRCDAVEVIAFIKSSLPLTQAEIIAQFCQMRLVS